MSKGRVDFIIKCKKLYLIQKFIVIKTELGISEKLFIENKMYITFKFTKKNKEKEIIQNVESGIYQFQPKEKNTFMIDEIKLYKIIYNYLL
jgi:hypothetical protein